MRKDAPVAPATVRDRARAHILATAGQPGTHAVLLSGAAGAGKSWLAQAALEALAADGVLVGSGKYLEAETRSALGPVMAALSGVVAQAMARTFDPQTAIASLTEALGVDLEVLIAAGLVVPGLAATSSLKVLADPRGGTTRIVAAALHLLRWLERFEAPRVLLIDDWLRASDEGLDLVRAIASATAGEPLTLLLTQREPVLDASLGEGIPLTAFALDTLDDEEVAGLLADRLDRERAALVMTSLADAMPRLPFDILQVADAFAQRGVFVRRVGRWRLDRKKAGSLAFDAATRVAGLPPEARRVATGLALWGDSAPRELVERALGLSTEAAAPRWEALEAEGIVQLSQERIRFSHDRLRRASLDGADPNALASLAGEMAERLHPAEPGSESEIAALELRCRGGLEIATPERWRDRFARGATAARGRGDSAAASSFAEAAFALRSRQSPEDPALDRLILREAVLAAADRDDPETAVRVAQLTALPRTMHELCEDYETGATALRLAGQREASWQVASEGLRRVGIAPPADDLGRSLWLAAFRWLLSRPLKQPPAGRLCNGDPLDALTGLAGVAAHIAYHRDPRATALIGFRASTVVRRASLRSAYWSSVDTFLFAALGMRGKAADAGERAVAALPHQRIMRAATLYQAVFFGVHWRRSLKSQRPRFQEVVRIARAEGDPIVASYGLRIHIMSGWRTTVDLDQLLSEAVVARRELRALGESSFIEEMEAMVALLEGLTGKTTWNPAAWRDDIVTRNHVIDLELSNLAGDWRETVRRAAAFVPLRPDYDVQCDAVVLRFHETVARLRSGLKPRRGDVRFLREAAALNPADHHGKLLLVEAELLLRRKRPCETVRNAFAAAVEAAARADSRMDEILALMCASEAAAAWGDADLASAYAERDCTIRNQWGLRAPLRPEPVTALTREALGEAEARAAAAERADQAKSRLLAHVGHELRTPLQALQTLLDVSAPGEKVELGEVRAILASLTAVVDDLNIASGLGEDAVAGITRAVDLAELLRSEMAPWRRDATLTLEVVQAVPPVDLAADRVRQVVRNLLSNAVKYGGGTPIELSLAAEVQDGRARIVLTVRDHGPGIASADLDRLFEPFHRGAFAGDGRGTGLGLTLARRIAERLGGGLVARNDPAGGACFELTIEAPLSSADAKPAAVTRSAQILLVEDAPLIRRLLATVLGRAGHRVSEAGDAAHAITVWQAGRFDLAILDMGLPDASGLTVLDAIRRSAAPVPVILLTAAITADVEAAVRDDPRVRLLRKPASAELLTETIAGLLETRTPSQPAAPVAAPDRSRAALRNGES